MTYRLMRIVRWIHKVTDTHSECVILIAFALQQWLHERASVLTLHVYRLNRGNVYRNFGASWRKHCCSGEAMSVTQPECVYL